MCHFIVSHVTCQFILRHVAYVSLYSVMWHVSVYTRVFYVCHFILSHETYVSLYCHATYVSLYSVMWHMSVYTVMRHVSLYSVMWHMSVYTRLFYVCHFILSHLTYVSLYSVMRHMSLSYSSPVRNPSRSGGCFPGPFILMCVIMKWVLPRLTFGVMNIWKATAFPFCLSCLTLDPKLIKEKLQRLSGRQLECCKY